MFSSLIVVVDDDSFRFSRTAMSTEFSMGKCALWIEWKIRGDSECEQRLNKTELIDFWSITGVSAYCERDTGTKYFKAVNRPAIIIVCEFFTIQLTHGIETQIK